MKQTKKTTDIQEEINIIIIVVNFIFQSKIILVLRSVMFFKKSYVSSKFN